MTAALRHRHISLDSNPLCKPAAQRWRYGLLALLVACLAIAGAILPRVWRLLDIFDHLPKMAWMQSLLAQWPVLSWSLMLVWGTAVSLALIATLALHWHWRGAVLVAGLTLWAVLWYVHMPNVDQCHALYDPSTACNTWQWVFSLSLALGTAFYMFAIFLLGLFALGLLFTRPGELSEDTPEE